MQTPNTNTAVTTVENTAVKTGFALTLDLVQQGQKLANGVYKGLTKAQKDQVRELRLSSAKQESVRMLGAEVTAAGYTLERREYVPMKKGVGKLTLVAYKRPAAPVVKVEMTPEESLAASAAFLGVTVEQLRALADKK